MQIAICGNEIEFIQMYKLAIILIKAFKKERHTIHIKAKNLKFDCTEDIMPNQKKLDSMKFSFDNLSKYIYHLDSSVEM